MAKNKYHTRTKANAGFKLFLKDPDTFEVTEDYILIRGMDSDAFRLADSKARRDILVHVKDGEPADESKYTLAVDRAERECVASLVIEWCFDGKVEVPTFEEVYEFLKEAPQVANEINKAAAVRANFSTNTCEPSTNGQKKKSK